MKSAIDRDRSCSDILRPALTEGGYRADAVSAVAGLCEAGLVSCPVTYPASFEASRFSYSGEYSLR
jgi:hypothetical protein